MTEKQQKAIELHGKGYNCFQSVACVFAPELDVDEVTAFRMGEGFGLGMGDMSQTCGAITGGLLVLGLKGASDATVSEYLRILKERHGGSLNCPDLLRRNQEVVKMNKKAHCDGMILESIQLAEELLA